MHYCIFTRYMFYLSVYSSEVMLPSGSGRRQLTVKKKELQTATAGSLHVIRYGKSSRRCKQVDLLVGNYKNSGWP